ncbi:hypothetical protein DF122_30095 [Burkholderia pseudomallei]|nr:hypothetical protein BOC35_08165 [Burkholderia pseudomallei]ARK56323.1 hypothetical protein BOC36_24960 [Burkholderia pseudomallei]ARL32929.1 hypothetical protein BOC48_27170 [Burkholderia pseudomallei]ARL77618.1 hypothetical protein BOC54_37115 [Burkholderia pseudomallei]ARL84228.1 hypothetical protein BOC55_35455 [Burkholderia pseudomallei]
MGRAVQILKTLNLSPEALAALITNNPQPAQAAPVPTSLPAAPQLATTEAGGTTIQEMVPRFATRKRNKLAAKTLYEYGNYHSKFVEWLETRKKKKHIPVHSVTRADVADFIDDLLDEGITAKTIQQKYLAAISGLFELAQTTGVIPEGQQLVSRGHKIFFKADAKKSAVANGYKAFTEDELKRIFQPTLLSQAERPADFWLPMLGLFTGGRISELAQMDIADVQPTTRRAYWGSLPSHFSIAICCRIWLFSRSAFAFTSSASASPLAIATCFAASASAARSSFSFCCAICVAAIFPLIEFMTCSGRRI